MNRNSQIKTIMNIFLYDSDHKSSVEDLSNHTKRNKVVLLNFDTHTNIKPMAVALKITLISRWIKNALTAQIHIVILR